MQQRRKPAPPVNPDPFMKPVPGWSLTQPKGKWPWDKPPRQVDPDAVVSKILDNLEDPKREERFVKLMFAGVSIEELVHSIAVAGFMEGEFTPDVAEIIKGPISIALMGIAADNNIPVKVYADEMKLREEMEGPDDTTILEMMRQRNPEFAQFVEEEYVDENELRQLQNGTRMQQGFLAVEAPEELPEFEEPEEEMGEEE